MNVKQLQRQRCYILVGLMTLWGLFAGDFVWSETSGKVERTFNAVVTDSQGGDAEIKNMIFYWEEKVSETAFVPHELREVPVKRGSATIRIRFDQIKQIDLKPSVDSALLHMVITLSNGKTGEFTFAVKGSFKGMSDFGDIEFPTTGLAKIVFK
ncbi:MAG: hypothetical protein H8K06_00340 [Nitrospira sp.]|nr:hypothetical protein [Nitrospira sp. CR1.1]MCS6325539.1 hypothetical protein [Nitrospira sp.]